MSGHKVKVAVVFGGRSSEHAVSCVTAGSVLAAMNPARYEVIPIGITRSGRWVLVSDHQQLSIESGRLPEVRENGTSVALSASASSRSLTLTEAGRVPVTLSEVDVVLPLLHGAYGEDGTLQGQLELAGVPYVGAGVLASAAGMDKAYTKLICAAQGLPTAPYQVVRQRDWKNDAATVVTGLQELGWPVFVKPARAGSSMGVSKATSLDELTASIALAFEHDPKVLVEAAVDGIEVECGVLESLDGNPPECSLPGVIRYSSDHQFYDFEAKYLGLGPELEIPPDLPLNVIDEVRSMAAAAFTAMECEGLARVDFFYTRDGRVLFNEINTMPGFTPVSAFPRMWQRSGLDYPALIDHLIQTALRRPTGLR